MTMIGSSPKWFRQETRRYGWGHCHNNLVFKSFFFENCAAFLSYKNSSLMLMKWMKWHLEKHVWISDFSVSVQCNTLMTIWYIIVIWNDSLIKEYLLSFALITDYEIDEFEFIVIFKRMFLFSREKLNDNALKSQCYGFKFSVIVSFEFE